MTLQEKNEELRGLLREARELIERGDFREGYCMCGSSVDTHTFGDGHTPCDAGEYYASQVIERIDAALARQAEPAPAQDERYVKGDTAPAGDCDMFEAGIHVDEWFQRIVVYGDSPEDAERLRDKVMMALIRSAQTDEEFNDSQWWFKELEQAVTNGTPNQRRALEVVRNLMSNVNQSR